MRVTLLGLMLAACATAPTIAPTRPVEPTARIYGFSEARTKELVREVLGARGLLLNDTPDPHILTTAPKVSTINHQTIIPEPGGRHRVGEEVLYTDERRWMVIFEPIGLKATAVRIARGEALVWANAAERGAVLDSSLEPARLDPKVPPHFVRDREQEAAVAAELDNEAAVEVSEAEQSPANHVSVLEDPPTPPVTHSSCELSEGELGPLLTAGHFVLLSDPLGAHEPWNVLGQVACLAEARGLPVTVALSVPSEEQGSVNRWLGSEGTPEDRARLLGGAFWRRVWQDGRSSEAVLGALERLRARRAAGAPVTILAVDTNAPGNARNAHIAAKLLKHRGEHPERLIVAMLGNVLTSRRIGAAWNPELMPVGARLAAVLPEKTHSFDVSFWEGAHWTCHLREQGKLQCGTWSIRPGPAQVSRATTPKSYFRVYPTANGDGFDGVYFVGGALTASVPAVESVRYDEGPRTLQRDAVGPLEAAPPERKVPLW